MHAHAFFYSSQSVEAVYHGKWESYNPPEKAESNQS